MDNSVTKTGYDRPNATGAGSAAANPTPNGWYNPAAFVEAPRGSFGNVGRDTAIAPGIFDINAEVHKNFRMPYNEHHQVQFRVEAFNLLNHPNFGGPNGNILAGARNSRPAGDRSPSGLWDHHRLGLWNPHAPVAAGIEVYVLTSFRQHGRGWGASCHGLTLTGENHAHCSFCKAGSKRAR